MSNAASPTVPIWFKAVAVLAILWGVAGLYACFTQLTLTPAALAALPAAQRDAFAAMPGWVKIDYQVAVISGFVGGILLLVGHRQAQLAFIVSLAAVILQFGWTFLIYGGLAKLGPSALAFPAFIAAVAAAEIWLATWAKSRGWLK